ncbi:hypothetical protein C8R43DRAFT_962606 [Mycena crocata]|nr:hypothetical protein C8R43DRAFT_962606 [Mycena crocata]
MSSPPVENRYSCRLTGEPISPVPELPQRGWSVRPNSSSSIHDLTFPNPEAVLHGLSTDYSVAANVLAPQNMLSNLNPITSQNIPSDYQFGPAWSVVFNGSTQPDPNLGDDFNSEPLIHLNEDESATFCALMADVQSSPEYPSSPPYGLSTISETRSNPVDPSFDFTSFQPHTDQSHSRNLVDYSPSPAGSNLSRSPRAFQSPSHIGIDHTPSPWTNLPHFSSAGTNPSRSSEGIGSSGAPVNTLVAVPTTLSWEQGSQVPSQTILPLTQHVPSPHVGHGSLTYFRERHTPAPQPAQVNSCAVYMRFPNHGNPADRDFLLTGVFITADRPSLTDLLHAVRRVEDPGVQILDHICAGLDTCPFTTAWSRTMIEVDAQNEKYSSLAKGYRGVGLLQNHLESSSVVLDCADPNETSRATFAYYHVNQDTKLFVVYIAQLNDVILHIIPYPPTTILVVAPVVATSHTPINPAAWMASILRIGSALDVRYLAEASQLAALLHVRYRIAYLQIRQVLIIDKVFFGDRTPLGATLTLNNVAAWAGIKPATYANNRTFAKHARGTLWLLLHQANSRDIITQLDPVQRAKDQELTGFLHVCFQQALVTEDLDSAESGPELSVGGATAVGMKELIGPYLPFICQYNPKKGTTVKPL